MKRSLLAGSSFLVLAAAAGAQVVQDGSFEVSGPAGPFAGPWAQTSTNFQTPLCNGNCFATPDPTFARTGEWFAWFGGIDTVPEVGTLIQTVSIPSGTPSLEFYMLGGATLGTTNNDRIEVLIDGVPVFTFTVAQLAGSPYELDWSLVTVDLTAYAGGSHELQFRGTTEGNGFIGNFFIDDVTITGGGTTTCYANCDNSTQAPVLNVADFTCFLTRFAAGDSYANCDLSTQAPVLNVADFTCFLQSFAAGCP